MTAGDANLRRISTGFIVPIDTSPKLREVSAQVRLDDGNTGHIKPVGVYMDAVPPGGTTDPYGCLPNGRILQTTVNLDDTGVSFPQQTQVFADTGTVGDGFVEFSCANPAGADGQTYTLIAVADVNADDLAFCGPGTLMSLACFNALADDDTDDPDNRVSRNAPRVDMQ